MEPDGLTEIARESAAVIARKQEMNRIKVELLKTSFWHLLKEDYILFVNSVLSESGFQQCIIDASRIWKERLIKRTL